MAMLISLGHFTAKDNHPLVVTAKLRDKSVFACCRK
jgi:hypothetical protein